MDCAYFKVEANYEITSNGEQTVFKKQSEWLINQASDVFVKMRLMLFLKKNVWNFIIRKLEFVFMEGYH